MSSPSKTHNFNTFILKTTKTTLIYIKIKNKGNKAHTHVYTRLIRTRI